MWTTWKPTFTSAAFLTHHFVLMYNFALVYIFQMKERLHRECFVFTVLDGHILYQCRSSQCSKCPDLLEATVPWYRECLMEMMQWKQVMIRYYQPWVG